MLKVLVLSNSPTPYNDALFAEVQRQPGVTLQVAYCTWLEPHRAWQLATDKGYPYVVLRGISIGGIVHVNPGIVRTIREFRPDVAILTGSYVMPTFHLAVLTLKASQIPWVYWGEEIAHDAAAWPQRALRTLLRRVLKRARGVLAIGTRARQSYARAGIPEARIADFRYYADVARFQLAPRERDEARAMLHATWQVGAGSTVFLYCGQLIGRKGIDTLLHAAAALRRDGIDLVVMLTGGGANELVLRALAASLDIGDVVRFVGFVQPDELPRYFAAADALVLPSHREGWGVVVPEALAAGLPVLASDQVNAAFDLVADGESGYRFSPGDAAALARGMQALAESPERRARMAAQARVAVREETPPHAAVRFVALADGARAGRDLGRIGLTPPGSRE